MAITFQNLGASANPDINNATDLSSYANSSWTPPTSGLILLFVYHRPTTGTANTPTVSGNGLTWTQIATVTGASDVWRITLFGANASGSSAGATTVAFAGQTQFFCRASFFHADGIDLSGGVAAAFVQAPTGTNTGTSGSISLSAAGASDNRPISGFAHAANEVTAPRTNWTEADDLAGSFVNASIETQYRSDAFETTASASWTTSAVWVGIAAELKAEGTAATLDQSAYRWRNDDGSESAATWAASENTDTSIAKEVPIRLRLQLDADGDPDGAQYRLDFRQKSPAVDLPESGDWGSPTVVLSPTASAWDDILWGGSPGCIVKVGSTYYLYYVGADGMDESESPTNRAIGVATSSDGVTFSKYGSNPIITYTTGGSEEEGATNPVVVYDGSAWHMWYGAGKDVGGGNVDLDIRYRTSTDGFTWTDDALILTNTGDEYIPIGAFFYNSVWSVYYLGPLSGGAGNLRRAYGADADTLGTTEAVLSGTFRGANGLNLIGEHTMLIHLFAGSSTIMSRTISRLTPGTISAQLDSYAITDSDRFAILLDRDEETWFMYSLDINVNDGDVVLRTATMTETSFEYTDWAAVAASATKIILAASANITASGENTTAQLTAPAGKTTGDFDAGRIQDDENPADSVDITADDYTELEWCIEADTTAVAGYDYEFRLSIGGVAIDTYTETPTLTISSGTTEEIGQAAETDAAQAISRLKAKALAQNSETDAAQTIARLKTKTLAQTSESDTAQPMARLKTAVLGLLTETGTPLPMTAVKTRIIGQASETDAAQTVTRAKARVIGQTSETDTALPLVTPAVPIGLVTETDTALPMTAVKTRAIGQVSDTSTALAVTAAKSRAIGLTTETDAAQALARLKAKAIGQASETDEALSLAILGTMGLAAETDTALPMTAVKSKAVGLASETDSPLAMTGLKTAVLGLASEVDSPLAMTGAKVRAIGIVVETDSGLALVVVKSRALGLVSETDAVQGMAGAKAKSIGLATETDLTLALILAAIEVAIYTATVWVNPSPTVGLKANPSPAVELKSNPSPTVTVKSG